MNESLDLFDDGYYTEDTTTGDDDYRVVEDGSDDSGGYPGIEDVIRDVLNDYFAPDEADQEGDEEAGQETDGDPETETDTEQRTETENGDGYLVDSEILSEINETLHQHADDVSGFMSQVTVSGNSVLVSLDVDSSSLLMESLEKQDEAMERMDHMNGLVVMVLFVLLFDILHRFAKRIIKNLTRGDDNKNAADS